MSCRVWLFASMVAALGVIAGCGEGGAGGSSQSAADPGARCPHEIKVEKCPFCNPALVESEGFCGEHGAPEALCVECRPYLKAAFRAKGDWCSEHEVPESQCVECNPALAEHRRPGEHGTAGPGDAAAEAGQCEHGIAQAKCPFCTPSLVESAGFCEEHGVAEALCVACRPYMEVAFKVKGDWCAEHTAPESQCVECNPELKKDPADGG